MSEEFKQYKVPNPLVDKKETEQLEKLQERYKKLIQPSKIGKTAKKVGNKVVGYIPDAVKGAGKKAKDTITQAELFGQCMKVVAQGFDILEKNAAKVTISEKSVIAKANRATKMNEITSLDEICLVRATSLSKIVNSYRKQDIVIAGVEGGATGFFGFAGLPFNLVLSTFIFYRAVQSIALMYGYDVKNDPAELIIAGEVFMKALSPNSRGIDELGSIVGKVMVMSEVTIVKQTVKKTWEEMANRGGVCLMIAQMRALSNKAAQKAIQKAGQEGLEKSLFKNVFELVGKKMTKDAVGKAVPGVGAVIGAMFDIVQMNKVLEYADVFYNKRFLIEKEARIHTLVDHEPDIVDVDYEIIEE